MIIYRRRERDGEREIKNEVGAACSSCRGCVGAVRAGKAAQRKKRRVKAPWEGGEVLPCWAKAGASGS